MLLCVRAHAYVYTCIHIHASLSLSSFLSLTHSRSLTYPYSLTLCVYTHTHIGIHTHTHTLALLNALHHDSQKITQQDRKTNTFVWVCVRACARARMCTCSFGACARVRVYVCALYVCRVHGHAGKSERAQRIPLRRYGRSGISNANFTRLSAHL